MRRAVVLATLLAPTAARAGTFEATPADDLETKIAALAPGDELIVHGGTYELAGRFAIALTGTAAAPITIRAAAGEHPVIHRAAADQNIWDLDQVAYLTIRGLEFTGGSAGVRIAAADHLTIEDCEIHGTADVALRANDAGQTYAALSILHNHIHDTGGTGEGMYLGCNDHACTVQGAIIRGNHVHHTNGATVSQGDGIELKEGGTGCVIADNVIHDTGYPCILADSAVGGAGNVIEGNVLWGCGDHGIQGSSDATIRNNIILSAAASGIALQPHQNGVPRDAQLVHNTIVKAAGDAIAVSGLAGALIIANNALYAQAGNAIRVGGDTTMLTVAGNRGVGGTTGIAGGFTASTLDGDLVAASYAGAPPMDVFPRVGSSLPGAGDPAYVTAVDFNGTARGGVADVGAYKFAPGGNPGWVLAAGFKDGSASGGPDAGVGGGGDAGGCCQTGAAPAGALPLAAVVALALRRRRVTARARGRATPPPR